MAVETYPATPQGLSLQARLEQLEAAIEEAHQILDKSFPPREGVVKESEPPMPSAAGTASRCQAGMERLNERLHVATEAIGVF